MISTRGLTTTHGRRRQVIQLNPPLVVGGLLILTLVLCALAAPLLAPYDPHESINRMQGATLVKAPYPPGTQGMLLGSDPLRRDLLSRLIYGSRITLIFCATAALVRVVIGIGLGMIAGWYQRAGRVIMVVAQASSAIPSLLWALLPLALINQRVGLQGSILAFVIVLSLTGWAETAVRCRLAVRGLSRTAFIDAAYALGLRRARILWRHIGPNLRDLIAVEAAYSMGAVLQLVAELAFLRTFVGGADVDSIAGRVLAVDAIYTEWGILLASGLRERGQGPWLFLAPLAAFTFAILACNLFAEGMRRRTRLPS